VLTAAYAEANRHAPASVVPERRRRRRGVFAAAGLGATVAAAAVGVVTLLPVGGAGFPTAAPRPGPRQGRGPAGPVTAQLVRLISTQSAAAMADSGTAVETSTTTAGAEVQGTPTTIDVTFSGPNVNYLIVGNGAGAAGVENRVVDGQLYLYIKGPDLQMHWYHDTSPDEASDLQFPDPRTLLRAVSPSAAFENLGRESVGGMELTHLRATTPGAIGTLGLPDIDATVTSFDVWVDSADVVRQMAVSSSPPGGGDFVCTVAPGASGASGSLPAVTIPPRDRISTLGDGKPVPPGVVCGSMRLGSTLDVRYGDLGVPETVAVPTGAVDQPSLG
jgi:hypothetical protein